MGIFPRLVEFLAKDWICVINNRLGESDFSEVVLWDCSENPRKTQGFLEVFRELL